MSSKITAVVIISRSRAWHLDRVWRTVPVHALCRMSTRPGARHDVNFRGTHPAVCCGTPNEALAECAVTAVPFALDISCLPRLLALRHRRRQLETGGSIAVASGKPEGDRGVPILRAGKVA